MSFTSKKHFRDLSLVVKQKVFSIVMHKLRNTTFFKGKSKIPQNLQFIIDMGFTKIPTLSDVKY